VRNAIAAIDRVGRQLQGALQIKLGPAGPHELDADQQIDIEATAHQRAAISIAPLHPGLDDAKPDQLEAAASTEIYRAEPARVEIVQKVKAQRDVTPEVGVAAKRIATESGLGCADADAEGALNTPALELATVANAQRHRRKDPNLVADPAAAIAQRRGQLTAAQVGSDVHREVVGAANALDRSLRIGSQDGIAEDRCTDLATVQKRQGGALSELTELIRIKVVDALLSSGTAVAGEGGEALKEGIKLDFKMLDAASVDGPEATLVSNKMLEQTLEVLKRILSQR
jgi:hypothetical protein